VPFVIILALLLLLGVTASCGNPDSAVGPPAVDRVAAYSSQAAAAPIPDRYIVTFQPGVADPAALGHALAAAHGGEVLHIYTTVLQGLALQVPAQALEGIRRNPNVRAIEPDQLVTVEDAQTGATWGIDRIDQHVLPLDHTYNFEGNGAGVTVYIFDTGIRFDHAEFEGRARPGYDVFNDGQNGLDCHGHGTHVAGTVGGKTYGVAKGVTLVAVRVLSCSGSGSYSGIIAAMDWVVQNNGGPAVANFSLGGGASSAVNSALTTMIQSGVATAVSAGNDGGDACLKTPASTPDAVTVGATTSSDARASYSNYGSCVDVFAPGSSITSAYNSSTTATAVMSGTSMASPHATGVLALLKGQQPDLNSLELRDWLVAIATQKIVIGANSPNAHLLYSLTGYAGPISPPPVEPPTDPDPSYPPTAPSNLRATVKGQSNVKLSWTDQSGDETGFRIERQDDSGLWTPLAATSPNGTSYTDSSAQKGQSYGYRVRAFNAAGASGASNEVVVNLSGSGKGNGKGQM